MDADELEYIKNSLPLFLRQTVFEFEEEFEILRLFKKWKADQAVKKLLKGGVNELRKILQQLVARVEIEKKEPYRFQYAGQVLVNRDVNGKAYIIVIREGEPLDETVRTFIHELVHIGLFQTKGLCAKPDWSLTEEEYDKHHDLMEYAIMRVTDRIIKNQPEESLKFVKEYVNFTELSSLPTPTNEL